MTQDLSHIFKNEEIVKKICYIGQPVQVCEDTAVLRLALGGDSFRQVVKDFNNDNDTGPGSAVADDRLILEKLNFLAMNYGQLKAHEDEVKKQQEQAILDKQAKAETTKKEELEETEEGEEGRSLEKGELEIMQVKMEIADIQKEIILKEKQLKDRMNLLKQLGDETDYLFYPSQMTTQPKFKWDNKSKK